MAIYTKKGDKGQTKVFDKKTGKLTTIFKASCQITAIGSLDELNSFLGVLASYKVTELQSYGELTKEIKDVQNSLFTINSILAGSKLRFSKTKVKKLEKQIDEWEGRLPVLKNFVFYGGSYESTLLFYARSVSRRAERDLVAFSKEEKVSPAILSYVNRLSDYLFMMARWINFEKKIKEEFWKGSK